MWRVKYRVTRGTEIAQELRILGRANPTYDRTLCAGQGRRKGYSFCPFTQSARIFQFGSSLDANCRPPEWKTLPPTSGASGCCNSLLVAGSPGFTRIAAISKLRRDC